MEEKEINGAVVKNALFVLLRYEICGVALSDAQKAGIVPEILPNLYGLAKTHDLVHLVADALLKNGLIEKDSPAEQAFSKQMQTAIFRYEQLQYELERICEALEEAQVPYMPLKGAVLRAYYPEPWMRTSCDIDIFVQKSDLERATIAVEKKLGYHNDGKTPHDMQMISPFGVHLELHYDLIEDDVHPAVNKVLSGIWATATPIREGAYGRKMSDEFFYFYHIAHMMKHFTIGGCGVRPFIDLWIIEKRFVIDEEKLQALFTTAGIKVFAESAKTLCEVWLEQKEPTHVCVEMGNYILSGGVYGNTENKAMMQTNQGKSKFKYICFCLFLPYKQMCRTFPVLVKHKWLLPFCWVVRWVKILFRGITPQTKSTIKKYSTIQEEKQDALNELMDELEL